MNAGTSVARDNRLATSVQTHFFDSGSAAAVGRQERWTQRLFAWLAKGGGRWKTLRATAVRGERASCAEKRIGEATYARGRKCENELELRGGERARLISRPVYSKCTGEHTGQKETVLWRAGVHTENAWSRRVGNALEWLGGRRVSARGSAHAESPDRSMSEAFRMYLLHSNKDLSCSGPARARNVAPFRMHLLYSNSVPNEGGRAVEGSEEHFDESEHVDDLAEEERSTDGEDGFGEEVDKTRENEDEGCRSPEGSDFAAEEGYEEDDSNAEEGHEGMWGEVQEAGSSMGNEDYDETALCARSQASRSSSSS